MNRNNPKQTKSRQKHSPQFKDQAVEQASKLEQKMSTDYVTLTG